ncbi:MAG: DUF1905 domain-containing protein [Nocardioides sp.]
MSEPDPVFTFTATLWRWQARSTAEPGAWCFVTVPPGASQEIRELTDGFTRGFGSVRVEVEAGTSRWRTSVFPDGASGCYVLPVKKAVRTAEGVVEDDELTVTISVLDAG